MRIEKHGVYYKHEIKIICDECECHYIVNNTKDINRYNKPKKILVWHIDCNWWEKRNYYTICPECKDENPITDMEYEILNKAEIMNVQKELRDKGYPVVVDGIWGMMTDKSFDQYLKEKRKEKEKE